MSSLRPKVLHLCASHVFSGAESVACSIIESLNDEYEGVYASPDGTIRLALEGRAIPFAPLRDMGTQSIRGLLADVRPDLIHAHDYTASLQALRSAGTTPVVSHIHVNNPLMRTLNLRSLAYGMVLSRFRGIVVVDQAVVEEHVFRRSMGRRAVVAPNYVDLSRVASWAGEEEAAPVDLLFVGRLTPQKDPIAFLQIVRKTADRQPNLRAAMVGDGEMGDEVRTAVGDLGLSDRVELRGFQSNPYAHIANAKVVVMPSKWEGFGLVAVETMALGVPLLARPVGGLRHVVGHSSAGRLLDTVHEFCDATCELLESPARRAEMGAAGRRRAAEFGDRARFAEGFRKVYAHAFAARSGGAG